MKQTIPDGGSAAGLITDAGRSVLRLAPTLLLFTLALLLLGGCASRDIAEQPPAPAASMPPALQHSGTQQQFHSFKSAGLTFHFAVTNPGPDTLQLHSYRYRLEEDSRPLVSGRQELAGRRVPAGGRTSLEVSIQLPLGEPIKGPQPSASESSLSEPLESSESPPAGNPAELPYTLSLEVLARSNSSAESEANENIQLTSEVDETLPLPQLPQVRIPEVVITQFKTHTIDIEYRVEISNPNSFPLVLSPAEYTFSVRGTVWDEDPLPQGLQIPPESSRSVNKPMVFNYLKAGRKTVDTLIGGKSIDYRITGTAAAMPEEQPATNKSSESALEIGPTESGPPEPDPYSFTFELEETAALIRP